MSPAPRLRAHHFIRRTPRALCPGPGEFIGKGFHPVISQRDELPVKRVGLNNVGSRLQVTPVDFLDDLGLREIEQLVVALEILALPIAESLSAELFLRQLVLLNGGAHGAIDEDNALLEQGLERMMGIRHNRGSNRLRRAAAIKPQIHPS